MKFEAGKHYRTRGGHKVQIFIPDNGNHWMLGALCRDTIWESYKWVCDGASLRSDFEDIVGEWKEPVKPKLLAPALYRNAEGRVFMTQEVFESKEAARKACGDYLVQWPARVNADGFYEVASDE